MTIVEPASLPTDTLWIDGEVHLLPPEWCGADYRPPSGEDVMLRILYDHPERELALPLSSTDAVLASMDATGILASIVSGMPWHDAEMNWRNNTYVADAQRAHPTRFIGLGILPAPHDCDLRDAVRRIVDMGLHGLYVIPSFQSFLLDDDVFEPALAEAEAQNLVVEANTDHLYHRPGRRDPAYALFEVARRHPGLRILAPHLGGMLAVYALLPLVREVLANTFFIANVPQTMRMIAYAADAAGADRIGFGTGFPYNSTHDQTSVRRAFEELPLEVADKTAIAGTNLARFLDWTP